MNPSYDAKRTHRFSRSRARLPIAFALVLASAACATVPRETFRGYAGAERPVDSVAIVDLGDASWVKIGYLYAAPPKYNRIALPPGVYPIEWGTVFLVSVMVDARGFAPHGTRMTVTLEAGHVYRLRADRTTGPGYKVFLWIVDVTDQRVVAGQPKA
jgi:hypothetical protein